VRRLRFRLGTGPPGFDGADAGALGWQRGRAERRVTNPPQVENLPHKELTLGIQKAGGWNGFEAYFQKIRDTARVSDKDLVIVSRANRDERQVRRVDEVAEDVAAN